MELRHLRYFIAVATHGSVAEAARKMNVAQPALSRQIHDLEDHLGIPLFQRTTKGTKLTGAGRQFFTDVTRLMGELDEAKERALNVANGQSGTLRIGVSPYHTSHPELLRRLRKFRDAYPEITVVLEPGVSMKQPSLIKEGKLDGGIMSLRDHGDTQLDSINILRAGLILVFASDHRFAVHPPIRLSELKDDLCIWFPRPRSPVYYDYIMGQCEQGGLTPKQIYVSGDVGTRLGMVATGMGYTIISEATRYNCPGGLALHRHSDLPNTYNIEFAFRRNDTSPLLQLFIRSMED
ncbi:MULTISPECIES: LysR family transcriptional regulator [unclassified Herbaspirillum]|uniref:LysR family transcriptional regulator n=1 Tax=unclassified Herbaspirillum TaxID=2624150 RepID=UPI000E2EDC49|nr:MULTISPECIES: LysR family transcriptional regulator [unclassified Herbaspirillum]RFB71326.1 LysR family transcriptional regulator [Herbaspirillum sp. 3R-3a1]TFI08300.1 LysR family transcriptional regulator [Herbaspirillum sp. 3R11]TFI14715.1 LysR family transcriptional regulator [Herbaspirillum sp. 3R-11]TFI31893.1 LysR family transcriptional regulator [Herbaspirillum sp. 3C11]TFI32024.1 LysR family transcriptional regulator [Herbaspirillum sp. 3C11]